MCKRNITTYASCKELLENDFFETEYFKKTNNTQNIHIKENSFTQLFEDEKDIIMNKFSLYDCDLSMIDKARKIIIVFQGDKVEQYQLSYDLLNDIKDYGNKDLNLLLGYHYSKHSSVTMIYV